MTSQIVLSPKHPPYTDLAESSRETKRARSTPTPESSSPPGKTLSLTPNSHLIKMTLDSVCSYPTPSKGAYVGCGFEMNFNVLAHRSFEHAYFYTDNPREAEFYHWTSAMITKTPSRSDFLDALEKYLEENDNHYLGAGHTARQFIFSLTYTAHSWLNNDDAYRQVHSQFHKGAVTIINGRLDAPDTMEALERSIKGKRLVCDVVSMHGSTYSSAQFGDLIAPETVLVSPRATQHGEMLDVTQPRAPVPQNRKELFHALRKRTFQVSESLFHGHPFLLTTETGHTEIFDRLSTIPTIDNGVYLGFAFELNYHILARRPVQKAYICDIHWSVINLHQWVQTTVAVTASRKEFIELFHEELFVNCHKYFPDIQTIGNETFSGYLKHVFERYTTLEYSWLRTDEAYTTIRNLYRNGQIEHLTLNIAHDTGRVAQMVKDAKQAGCVFDVVYLTNIAEWVYFDDSEHFDAMCANLQSLLSDSTIFIDAKREVPKKGLAASRLNTGRALPDFTTYHRPAKQPPPLRKKGRRYY